MRAGKLDRLITLQSVATSVDANGTPSETWTDLADMRAQVIQQSTDEALRGYGESATAVYVFRTRWLDGVTTAHRVSYAGAAYNIREIKEIGRREGLELRCEEVRA